MSAFNRRDFLRFTSLGSLGLLWPRLSRPRGARSVAPIIPQPGTVDEVVALMEDILAQNIAQADRRGYFAALYYLTTQAVRAAILNGDFEDNARMATFTVAFAQRYFDAYYQYLSGELPSQVWLHTLETTGSPDFIILQYAVQGVNAHINLDLGITAARIAPGDLLPGLKNDFDTINDIIASVFVVLDERLDTISPVYAELSGAFPGLATWLVNFSIKKARDAAWQLAQELAYLGLSAQLPVMAQRDVKMTQLSHSILHQGPLIEAIYAAESQDVAFNIARLAFNI